jgi:hypothetical protein
VCIQLAVELGFGDEAPPTLADGGGAVQGGLLRRDPEEDLPENVVAVRQVGRRRRRRVVPAPSSLAWILGWRRGLQRRTIPAPSSLASIWGWRRGLRRRVTPALYSLGWIRGGRRALRRRVTPAPSSMLWIWGCRVSAWTTVSAARVGFSFVRLYGVQQNKILLVGFTSSFHEITFYFPLFEL